GHREPARWVSGGAGPARHRGVHARGDRRSARHRPWNFQEPAQQGTTGAEGAIVRVSRKRNFRSEAIMIEDRQEELSDEEAAALRSLKLERLPPPGMEERVVAHLRKRGLLRSGPGRRWLQVAAGLAACLGLFFAGVEIGARRSPVPSQPVPSQPAGERFILLLYEGAAYVHAAPG